MIEPAYLSIPPRSGSYGDEAIDLARLAGRELDEEQCLAVDGMRSYRSSPDGALWAAFESVIVEPRQNGKTAGVLLPVVLFDLFLLPADRIVWTAHLFRTSRDAFDDFCVCIETTPELSKRVKQISYGHGEEYIELHPPRRSSKSSPSKGAKLEFLARSKGGGRGLGGKRVVMDEALFLAAASMGALMPVLSARPDPQINYGSSAAKTESDQLHALIARGRAGGDPSLMYVEWCAPGSWDEPGCERGEKCSHFVGVQGCSLDDEDLQARANHSRGKRITAEYISNERRALTPREFGRERLGWHEASSLDGGVIPDALWQTRLDPASRAVGRVGVAVDASPDLRSAAIGMAGLREDGKRHWQVLRHDAGAGWVVPHLLELRAGGLDFGAVGIDPGSPAGALIPDIKAAGFEVEEITGRTLVQAWGSFRKGVDDGDGRHVGQHTLDQAIRDGRNAPSGDVERFSRKKSTGDICPMVSVVEADHMLRTSPGKRPEPLFAWSE